MTANRLHSSLFHRAYPGPANNFTATLQKCFSMAVPLTVGILCTCLPAAAQRQAAAGHSNGPQTGVGQGGTLLWLKGTKKNDSTLVLPGGGQVVWHPSSNSLTTLPAAGDAFALMEKELDQTDQDAQQLVQLCNSDENGAKNYPIAQAAKDACTEEKQQMQAVLDPQLTMPPAGPKSGGTKPDLQSSFAACAANKVKYDDLMLYVNAHKNDKSFNFADPPYRAYEECWSCHPEKQTQYDADVLNYDTLTFATENQYVRTACGLLRDLGQLGIGNSLNPDNPHDQLILQLLGSSSQPTACTWVPEALSKLPQALDDLATLSLHKAQALYQHYSADDHRVTAGIYCYLTMVRNYVMIEALARGSMGVNIPEEKTALQEVGLGIDFFVKTLESKLFKGRDYRLLGDFKLLVGACRDLAIITGNTKYAEAFVINYLKFDRFTFDLDIQAKMGGGGIYQLAHITGKNYIRAVPADEGHGCIQWVLINAKDNNCKLNLAAVDYIAPAQARPAYAGTHDWYCMAPDMALHSCENGTDTFIVHAPNPVGNQELWKMPYVGVIPQPVVSGLFNACFLDREHLEQSAAALEANQGKMQAEMEQKVAAIQARMARAQAAGQSTDPKAMQAMAESASLSNDIQQTMSKYAPNMPGNFVFTVHLQNGNKVLLSETIDGKKLFPDNTAIVYANCKATLTQETDIPVEDPTVQSMH